MSLDGGGISNSPGAQDTASAMEEDYCLHGRERFHHQWATTGVFQPGALRLYGITGEPLLLRAIKQTRMLSASFGTCFLGRFPTACEEQNTFDRHRNGGDKVVAGQQSTQDQDLPFQTLLLGPVQPAEFCANPQLEVDAWRREVASAYDVLQMPSEWCHVMNGVVTEANWTTQAQRRRIQEQLELGSFMGLRAVQVPLPFYAPNQPWTAEGVADVDDSERTNDGVGRATEKSTAAEAELAHTLSPDDADQQNTRLACLAADILLAFIQQGSSVKVWVRCDGCNPAHRYQMQRLRQAVLYGYTRHTTEGNRFVYRINPPCSVTGARNSTATATQRGDMSGTSSSSSVSGKNKNGASSSTSAAPAAKSGSSNDCRGATVHTEAVSALVTMLYFSAWHPRMALPSEWFGEQVVCFECPPAPLLLACMAPRGVAPPQHPHYCPEAALAAAAATSTGGNDPGNAASAETSAMLHSTTRTGGEDGAGLDSHLHTPTPPNCSTHNNNTYNNNNNTSTPSPYGYHASRRSSPARLPDLEDNEADMSAVFSATNYSLGEWAGDVLTEGQHTPAAATAAVSGAGVTHTHTPAMNSFDVSALGSPCPPEGGHEGSGQGLTEGQQEQQQRLRVLQSRYRYVMPDDLHPLSAARWAGGYPPCVSVVTFLVEMLRRRAFPLFDRGFFDQYPLLNYLYFKAVEEPTRDVFASFEGQLQLPLQPLGHQLSSGVYEVFERDARKYRQYREAIFSYVKDWYNAGPAHQHAWRNKEFFAQHGVMREVPMPSTDERVLHLVLLGCGRGPLIDECLNAVSALGVRLRLFAIEKNRPAAAFTRMRWANDPEWGQLAYTFGHTLEVIVADGRHLAEAATSGAVALPPDFGLCDVVVSELLGSLGDNELSPECLEEFHAQLRLIQAARGLRGNPHLACIPQSYTAWVAPLMSASLEAAVAEAAVKGLTVAPPDCPDPHAALDHSLLVTNLSRGITLAAPQACWTFSHDFRSSEAEEKQGATQQTAEQKSRRTATGDALAPTSPHSSSPSSADKKKKSTKHLGKSNAPSLDRTAHLSFIVPPCGRCSGLAGYFSCVLYTPFSTSSSSSASCGETVTPITLSTAPAQRTEDMYSWFPCTFTLDPTQRRELHEVAVATQQSAVSIHVDLARKTSTRRRQVWYEWSVRYGGLDDGDAGTSATADVSGGDAAHKTQSTALKDVVVHNRDGWASSMLL